MLLPNSSLLRPKLIALALWVAAFLIWLTYTGLPLQLQLPFSKPWPHSDRIVSHLDTGPVPVSSSPEEHPIKTLVRQAEVEFEQQLARQSTTLEAAVAEYLHRYHRDPPPGFESWYGFAVKHGSLVIDDFDIIDEALAPFWGLSGV